ncbi:MAG: hypothetical protein WA667_19430 [Candidatus Nitrosopolaris sp.]
MLRKAQSKAFQNKEKGFAIYHSGLLSKLEKKTLAELVFYDKTTNAVNMTYKNIQNYLQILAIQLLNRSA